MSAELLFGSEGGCSETGLQWRPPAAAVHAPPGLLPEEDEGEAPTSAELCPWPDLSVKARRMAKSQTCKRE